MNFAEVATQELPQSVYLYGPPFAGKTHMAAELANHGYHIIWLDLQQGGATIRNAVAQENWKNIDYYLIPTSTSNNVAIETVGMLFESRGPVKFCIKHGKVNCAACKTPESFNVLNPMDWGANDVVVVDSTTELTVSTMQLATRDRDAKLYVQSFKAERDDYSYQGKLLDKIVQNIQNRPFHRVFIGHEAVIEQTDGTEIIQPSIGTRNYSSRIGSKFDHLVYCYLKNKRQWAACGNGWSTKIQTGTRGSVLLEDGVSRLVDVLRNTQRTLETESKEQAKASTNAASKLLANVKR